MSRQPTGAAFDIVLILHVACVVVGLVATVTSAATASRLRRLTERRVPLSDSVGRYFAPGVNWAGRAIYGIPVFGFALLAMSKGAYALGDGWVLEGLLAFAAVLMLAEGCLWPAERRLQASLVGPLEQGVAPGSDVLGDATVVFRSAVVGTILLVAASALMVAQP